MSGKFRKVIRIARTNLDGSKKLGYALANVKGIGIRLANAIVEKAGLDLDTRLGFLSDGEVGRIERIVENLSENEIPDWLLNRRWDRKLVKTFTLSGQS